MGAGNQRKQYSRSSSINASVATSADGQFVDVAWVDTPGSGDIFYARLTNFGATLGPQINLSNNRGASEDYQLLREGSNVYVVWRDKTTASFGGEIYFIRSTNDGAVFWRYNQFERGNRPDISGSS